MRISKLYQLFLECSCVSTDSRRMVEEAMFFALSGSTFDGNRFVNEAFANGAKYAVIDNPYCVIQGKTVLVDDVLTTLQQIACFHRKELRTPVVGITGTNGKTTTKELIAATLSTSLNVMATKGNLNNHIGVPLTMLGLNEEHDVAVVEMGASKKGDIRELATILRPDCGIVTNIGHAHLEGFGSIKTLAKTKGELYHYMKDKPQSVVFVKSSDRILMSMSDKLNRVTYGSSPDDAVSGAVVGNNPCMAFSWKRKGGEEHTVQTNLVGRYNLDNVLAAIAVGLHFDIPEDKISMALAQYIPTNGRSQIIRTGCNTLVMDAYNANPDSMRAAVENFNDMPVSPKAVILGDMNELGEDSLLYHTEILLVLKQVNFDKIILCGKQFREVNREHQIFDTTADLAAYLKANPMKGYNILLKASRNMEFEKLTEFL